LAKEGGYKGDGFLAGGDEVLKMNYK